MNWLIPQHLLPTILLLLPLLVQQQHYPQYHHYRTKETLAMTLQKAKDHILLGPFQSKTKFPTVNGRRFRAESYNTYPWLEYSLELNHAFCFPCRLRNERKHETAFTATSFNQWKNGTLRLNDHQAANCHKESFERWKTTLQNYNNNTDVLKLLNQQYSKQATENRTYLKEIIRTVHFLARQGVSCKLCGYL
ncbi:unnamed protein product [Rotaria sordida]|uniref:TTF-type domain-containing protein n=1 Tax=Rotaria sordida TaxID=392033 RepID=A0A813NBI6_9BILA|nr:unnamed protein product [Rotaria sordida]CAF0815817.1 unnamed protein product [Rotaria sordida]